jgi:hypothetical protein
MVDRLIAFLAIVVIPTTTLATVFGWLSLEFALSIVWGTTILAFAIGFLKMWQEPEADYGRGKKPGA